MRIGVITSIDTQLGKGIILDENEQEIEFHFSSLKDELVLCSQVGFEIELAEDGLVAVGLIQIKSWACECLGNALYSPSGDKYSWFL